MHDSKADTSGVAHGGDAPASQSEGDVTRVRRARPESARDRGARLVREAVASERIRLARQQMNVSVVLADGANVAVFSRTHADVDRRRRLLLALYRADCGLEAPREALQAMGNALADAADKFRKDDLAAGTAAREEHGEEEDAESSFEEATTFVRTGERPPSQADGIVALVVESNAELFETPGGDAYITTRVGGRMENWPLTGRDFKRWVRKQYYEKFEKAPKRDAINDAVGVLQGRAMNSPQRDVHLRVAGHEGHVYVDLADNERRVVDISSVGWCVTQDVPVRFRRPPGMLPLPVPVKGGAIDDIRPLLNVPDDDAWVLLVGFLLGCLHPAGPYILLVLLGEQGTAKSTTSRILVLLIDPKDAPLRRPPREERDLAIAARNGYLIVWNNVSQLSDSMSDAISSLATEGGIAFRTLYENEEETRFNDRRPAILNGIDDFVTKGDLSDRSIKEFLKKIKKGGRRLEADVLRQVASLRPGVLGALYDAVSVALRDEPGLVVEELPRMADAARWITAGEIAFGWPRGTFLSAYKRMSGTSIAAVVESSAVAGAIRDHAARAAWRGGAGDLLRALKERHPDLAKHKEWPTSPQGMSSVLRRFAPSLREMGFTVEQDEQADPALRTKLWTLGPPGTVVTQQPAAASASSAATSDPDLWTCTSCGMAATDAHECPGGVR